MSSPQLCYKGFQCIFPEAAEGISHCYVTEQLPTPMAPYKIASSSSSTCRSPLLSPSPVETHAFGIKHTAARLSPKRNAVPSAGGRQGATGCRSVVSLPRQAHLWSALRSGSVPASRDRREFLQQQFLAQRVESEVLPHIDADGPNLTETKQDVLTKVVFPAPHEHGSFDAADLQVQHETVLQAVIAPENLLQPALTETPA